MKVVRHFQVKASKALSLITNSSSFADFMFTEFLDACRLCPMELGLSIVLCKRPSTSQKIRMISDVLS
jgi:hypothetical protein